MIEGGWCDLITSDLFWPYAVFFWGVVALRVVFRRITRAELLVLGLLVLHHLLEIFQLGIGSNWHFSMLPHRYFGVAAPLAWCWTAYGLVQLWGMSSSTLRLLGRLTVLVLFLYVVGYLGVMKTYKAYVRGSVRDIQVALEKFDPLIRADYRGPSRWEPMPYSSVDYFSPKRPFILGAALSGDWAKYDTPYPRLPDYWMMYEGDEPPKDARGKRWPAIGRVRSLRSHWVLYRNPCSP